MDSHDTGCKRKLKIPEGVYSRASIVGEYRYWLKHLWAPKPYVAFFMMNPSGADETVTDSTVSRCDQFARSWGFGGTFIGNACAYRATKPEELLKTKDPVGERNTEAWHWIAKQCDSLVIAHGRLPGNLQRHADKMVSELRGGGYRLSVLKLLPGNVPAHPLGRGKGWIPKETQLQEWN